MKLMMATTAKSPHTMKKNSSKTLSSSAGVMSKLCNYPLLSWKNTYQQGRPLSVNPSVVYRGLPMACLNLGGTTAVQFGATGFFQQTLGTPGALTSSEEISAALLGGLVSGVPCSLWELCMIQQQNTGGSLMGTPANLVQKHGVSILVRGLITTCGRESLFTMAMLGLTPVLKREFETSMGLDKNMALAASSLCSAFTAGFLTHPLDTIKTCMQGDLSQEKFTNIRGTKAMLMSEGGVKSMFRGFGFRVGLITTSFFLVNHFKEMLAPVMF